MLGIESLRKSTRGKGAETHWDGRGRVCDQSVQSWRMQTPGSQARLGGAHAWATLRNWNKASPPRVVLNSRGDDMFDGLDGSRRGCGLVRPELGTRT
jgi:hypothetical protein